MPSENMKRIEKWQEAYYLAVVEVDAQKMPERIAAARQAIGERLQALGGDLDRTEEKKCIERSLGRLASLDLETRSAQLHSERYRGSTLDPEY